MLQDQDGGTASSIHTVTVGEPQAAAGRSLPPVPVADTTDYKTVVSTNFHERDFYKPTLETELAILRMTEGLNSLNGFGSLSISDLTGLSDQEFADDHVTPQLKERYRESEGFSSGKGYRGTISIDPTDECGRFFIDTIVRQDMLSITARSTIDPARSSGVVSFSASLANGQPLPQWISEVADGEYLLDRSVDLEAVALKLLAHRENGSVLTRYVEIDTLTGQIREQQQASTFSASFYDLLEPVAGTDEIEVDAPTE